LDRIEKEKARIPKEEGIMATKAEIKKVILDLSGNPESGVIAKNVDAWAEAIAKLDEPQKAEKPAVKKETRVLSSDEER